MTRLWSTKDIAKWQDIHIYTVRRHVQHPKFPPPVKKWDDPSLTGTRGRFWVVNEVKEFYRARAAQTRRAYQYNMAKSESVRRWPGMAARVAVAHNIPAEMVEDRYEVKTSDGKHTDVYLTVKVTMTIREWEQMMEAKRWNV